MKKIIYDNTRILTISDEMNIPCSELLTKDLKVLEVVQNYIQENGIEQTLSELEDMFNLRTETPNQMGLMFHMLFDSAAAKNVYPNNLGCYNFTKWLCYAFEFGRIKVRSFANNIADEIRYQIENASPEALDNYTTILTN